MRKGYRKISVNGAEYEWKLGRNVVDIRSESLHLMPTLATITGLTPHEVERAVWKNYFSVTPGDVRDYIVATQGGNHG
jgi:hypothetical protein